MSKAKSSKWERCGANICPLDPDLTKRSWFVDEEICTSLKYRKHPAVLAQKHVLKRMRKGKRSIRVGNVRKILSEDVEWTGEELLRLGEHLIAMRQKRSERAKALGIADRLKKPSLAS